MTLDLLNQTLYGCTHVYVYMYVCVCTDAQSHVNMYVEPRSYHWVSSFANFHFISWDTISHWEWSSLVQLNQLDSKLQGSSCLHASSLGFTLCLDIYVGSKDSNPSLHDWEGDIVLTEPPLSPMLNFISLPF